MQTTVIVCGVEFDVEFDYSKPVKATRYQPAEGGEVDLNEVFIGGQEVTDIIRDRVKYLIREKIEEKLFEMIAEECIA